MKNKVDLSKDNKGQFNYKKAVIWILSVISAAVFGYGLQYYHLPLVLGGAVSFIFCMTEAFED